MRSSRELPLQRSSGDTTTTGYAAPMALNEEMT